MSLALLVNSSNSTEQLYKRCYIHTSKYYSILKRSEILICATTWKNLENMLSKRSQSQRLYIV